MDHFSIEKAAKEGAASVQSFRSVASTTVNRYSEQLSGDVREDMGKSMKTWEISKKNGGNLWENRLNLAMSVGTSWEKFMGNLDKWRFRQEINHYSMVLVWFGGDDNWILKVHEDSGLWERQRKVMG